MVFLIILITIILLLVIYCAKNKSVDNNIQQKETIKTESLIESNKTCLCGYQSICLSQEGICSNLCISGDDCDD